MKKVDLFLKKTLGDDFFESLEKFELYKPGTRSVLDHEEIRTALQIVPRTVMALLIREIHPMQIGENKDIPLFIGANALLKITKHENDVYSGDIQEDNKKIAEFKFRSLPGVGLVIMSAFELYDMENLINSPTSIDDNSDSKVQKLIDERMMLHGLVNSVVDQKLREKDAIHQLMMRRLTDEMLKQKQQISEVAKLSKETAPMSDPYFRGMANGVAVANAIVNKKEPEFVDAPKKSSPVKSFLENRKKKLRKNEFSIEMIKSENVHCPDCGKNIFDGQDCSPCICYGPDMDKKVYIKKSEDGFKIKFGRSWDKENISMLLEVLRNKRG